MLRCILIAHCIAILSKVLYISASISIPYPLLQIDQLFIVLLLRK